MADKEADGSVIISTQLDTSEFERSIEKIQSSLTDLSGQIEKQAANIANSMQKLNTAAANISGNTSKAINEVKEDVKDLAEEIADDTDKSGKEVDKSSKRITDRLKDTVKNMQGQVKGLTEGGIKGLGTQLKSVSDSMAMKVIPLVPKDIRDIGPIPLQYKLLAKAIIEAETALVRLNKKQKESNGAVRMGMQAANSEEKEMDELTEAIKRAINAQNELNQTEKEEEPQSFGEERHDPFRDMAEEAEKASKPTGKLRKLTESLKKLYEKLPGPVRKALKPLTLFAKPLEGLGKIFTRLKGKVASFLDVFGEIGQDIEGVIFLFGGSMFGRLTELGSNLTEVQNVVDVTFEEMSEQVNEFAKSALKSFGLSEVMAKQFVGSLGAMAKSFGFTTQDALNMSESLTALAGDVASFYNLDQKEAYNKLKAVFTGETEGLNFRAVA